MLSLVVTLQGYNSGLAQCPFLPGSEQAWGGTPQLSPPGSSPSSGAVPHPSGLLLFPWTLSPLLGHPQLQASQGRGHRQAPDRERGLKLEMEVGPVGREAGRQPPSTCPHSPGSLYPWSKVSSITPPSSPRDTPHPP